MTQPILIFDMDGVLVDVSESYRETIQCTVQHFTGERISRDFIQEIKNKGGWNDDWRLCHHLINGAGKSVEYQTIVDHFQSIFQRHGLKRPILCQRSDAVARLFALLAARLPT